LRKILRSKKGISPILATLLVIVITVAAVIVTYAWVMTFTRTQTQQAGVMLIKEDVSWPNSTSISVTISNTGTSNGKVTAAYLGTSSTNLNLTIDSVSPTLPQTVSSGLSTTLTLNLASAWSANTRYYFKFATDTPAILEFNEKSPQ